MSKARVEAYTTEGMSVVITGNDVFVSYRFREWLRHIERLRRTHEVQANTD